MGPDSDLNGVGDIHDSFLDGVVEHRAVVDPAVFVAPGVAVGVEVEPGASGPNRLAWARSSGNVT